MKKILFYFTTIAIIVSLASCSKYMPPELNPTPTPTPTPTGPTMTFFASMPDEGPTTRVSLEENGTNIKVRWKVGDVIEFAVQQGTENATKLTSYELVEGDIIDEAKTAKFTVDITEVNPNEPFTLYGVHNGGGIAVDGTNVNAVLPKRAFMAVEDNTIGTKEKDVMLYCSKIIQPGDQINKVYFYHIGSIIAIHVTANRNRTFDGFELTGPNAGSVTNFNNSEWPHWAYNSFYPANGNYSANTFNLESEAFSNNGPGWDTTSDNFLHIRKEGSKFNIAANTPTVFYAWYPIIGVDLDFPTYKVSATWPKLRIDAKGIGTSSKDIKGDNWTKGARKPTRGKTYHFYVNWDSKGNGTGSGYIKWIYPTID